MTDRCKNCNGTGYKDYAGFCLDTCDCGQRDIVLCPVCGALPIDQTNDISGYINALHVLAEAVALYGKPGGPWNVPSDPGGWLRQAKDVLESAVR